MRPMRARPCARLAQTKLTTLDSAGAPLTKATARFTIHGSAAMREGFLDEHRGGGAFDEPERQAEQRPRRDLAAERRFRTARSGGRRSRAIRPAQPKRCRISRYSARTVCGSAPTGLPGRSFGFQAYTSPCSQLRVRVTKRLRNSAADDRARELRRRHIVKVGDAARRGPRRSRATAASATSGRPRVRRPGAAARRARRASSR